MARTYELTPFLGAPQPVELAARVLEVAADGRGLTLRCGTDRHEPELQDYYGTVAETVFTPPSPGRDVTVRIDVWTPHVVRVRYLPDGLPGAEPPSAVLTGRPDPEVAVEVREDADRVVLTTSAVELTVLHEPLRLELRNSAGALLWATKPVDIDNLRRPDDQWSPAEQRWLFLHRYAYPLGSGREGGRTVAFGSFDLRHDEHVHRFGEGFGRFDKVGTAQRLWIQEAFSNASPASYKQVPWYWSSRGYGLFVHTTQPLAFRVGDLEHSALSVVVEDTAELDLFVVAAATAREALPRYTALTGAPAVPPRWSLGLWMSRITYRSQEEVEQVAARLREHRIPCDVIHVDTGWFATEYTCDLTFSPERFPDPAGMCARLAEQGFKVSLWQWPNYNVASPLFDEGVEGGYLARRSSGHTYTFAGGYGQDAGFVDFSNSEAVAWYQGKLAALFDAGVAAIKVDYGEGAPPQARYANASPTGMRNLYPLLYQEAVWNASVAARGPRRGRGGALGPGRVGGLPEVPGALVRRRRRALRGPGLRAAGDAVDGHVGVPLLRPRHRRVLRAARRGVVRPVGAAGPAVLARPRARCAAAGAVGVRLRRRGSGPPGDRAAVPAAALPVDGVGRGRPHEPAGGAPAAGRVRRRPGQRRRRRPVPAR